jgi:hypothetical protein
MSGNAMAEVLVALLGLSPLIAGIPLLGKQLDIKQKGYDSARYVAWERTVWRSDASNNRKTESDVALEMRDRTMGDPHSGLLPVESVRVAGVTENLLWRDQAGKRLLNYEAATAPVSSTERSQAAPVEVGYALVPGITYGEGPMGAVENALQLRALNVNRESYTTASVSIEIRSILTALASRHVSPGIRAGQADVRAPIVQTARSAVLSDTWSARDESTLRRRVDDLTVNELIQALELPGRPIALQALGKGHSLFGEGQFGWDADLQPRSDVLPAAYVSRP